MRRLALAIVAVSFIGADDCIPGPQDRAASAEREASTYLAKLGVKIEGGIACSGADSDYDGYVSCSYRMTDDRDPRSILCAYDYRGSGCKRAPEKILAPSGVERP